MALYPRVTVRFPGLLEFLTDPPEVGEDPEALALAEVVGAEPSTVYPCRHPEHPKEAGASASSGCRGVES